MNIDRQKFFDTAVAGLASQGFERAVACWCKYRDKKGRRCAIGWNIPDEQYNDSFENKKGHVVLELLGYDISGNICFISGLQKAHDQAVSPEDMKCHLRSLANEYGLRLPKELQ